MANYVHVREDYMWIDSVLHNALLAFYPLPILTCGNFFA